MKKQKLEDGYIYYVYNMDYKIIYIGKTKDLIKRLGQHGLLNKHFYHNGYGFKFKEEEVENYEY